MTSDSPTVESAPELQYDPPPERKRFAPGEVLRLLVGLGWVAVGLLLATAAKGTISGAESDLIEEFTRLPDRIEQAVVGVAQLVAMLVPLVGLVLVVWGRRWRVLFELWLASVLASLATALTESALSVRESSSVLEGRAVSSAWLTDPDFPTTTYLAGAAAMVAVAGPWVSRRWRRALWGWVILLVVLRVLGSVTPVLDVGLAVAIGFVVGTLIVLVFGAPSAEPSPGEFLRGLRSTGLRPSAIARADVDAAGPVFIVSEPDRPTLFVKVRTPDDRSSDLLNRIYRAARLRSSEFERPYSTLKRRVEHEALMLMTAARAGVRTPQLVTVGDTEGGSAFLVLERVEAAPMGDLSSDDMTDDVLRDLWSQVAALHSAQLSHRELALENMLIEEATGHVWLVDMDAAEMAASDRQCDRDVAALLTELALMVGPERATDSALEELGPDPLVRTLAQLQPLALPPATRRRLRGDKSILDRLRAVIKDRTGASDVELDRLERIKPRTVVMLGAVALAFYALLPQFSNIDDTIAAFGGARWEWIPALIAASVATYVFATVSLLGSLADPVPIAAAARSTVASSFAALIGPATAGRVALAVRFLQRAGFNTADASASTALNSAAGLITHLLLMFSFFAWTGSAGVGGFSAPDANTVVLILAVIAALLALAMLLGPVRRRVLTPALEALRRAQRYVSRVMRSPTRVLALFVGSSFITLSYVAALVFSIEAFGGGLSIPQIGAAYLGAAAIANLAPTPGGLGALEAALIAALTGFGLPDAVAVSSVLTFRLATYWLPILPGWLTLLWMERRDEV